MIDNSTITVKQLRATLEKMEVALGAIVEAIVWTDAGGKVQWSNATFDRLVNKQRFQVLGASLFDLLPLEQQGQKVNAELHPLSITLKGQDNVTGVYEFPQTDSGRSPLAPRGRGRGNGIGKKISSPNPIPLPLPSSGGSSQRLVLEISSTRMEFQGELSSAVIVIRDITKASQASAYQKIQFAVTEDALRAEEEFLQLVLDNIPQFIFWKDRNSVYLGCNRNFARAAGFNNSNEIVGKTDYDFAWKKEESDFFRECDARVMETNTPEYHIIEPQLQADGKQAWVDTNKIPLHDSAGNVVGILGTYEDITERVLAQEALLKVRAELEIRVEQRTSELKSANELLLREISHRAQVEENLRKSQEMLQLVMDSIPQFICWKDTNSVYLGGNRNFAHLAGVGNPENIIGKTDYDLPWLREQADFFRARDAHAMETNTPEYNIIEPLSVDGRQAWLNTNKIPLHDAEGKVVGILVASEDITERKRAEEEIIKALEKEKQLSELKSRFITTTSHEFRTPLATILSSAELLQKYSHKFSDEKKLKHKNQIISQVTRMTHLLDDVLFVGKASAGRMEVKPVDLNLEAFCRDFLE